MSAKSTDTIDPYQIDWSTLKETELKKLNDSIFRDFSRKEIGEIDFRVIGNLVLARTKVLSVAVNRELLEPISKWLNDQSWLERFKISHKGIPDWARYKRRQRLWSRQERALAGERLRLYRQEVVKKRRLRHELNKIFGRAGPRGAYRHRLRGGFIVPIASPFSPPEQHREKTRRRFLQARTFSVSDLLPWKLLITAELTRPKKLGDLKKYFQDSHIDSVCKIMHLLQMESEGRVRLTQKKPFGDITLESLKELHDASFTITDEFGKDYQFDWLGLTDAQRKKIIADIHKHRILCRTA